MRYMLYPYSPDYPIYFGHRFKPYVDQGYMSGGAGYVLSKEALKRFVEQALPDKKNCNPGNGRSEDVEMGKCLSIVNVIAGDSRDSEGRGTMFPFYPESHMFPDRNPSFWYWKWAFYDTEDVCIGYVFTILSSRIKKKFF